MDKLTVIDGEVAHRGVKLGAGLIADSNELKLLTEADGVLHMETPHRIDMLFAAGDKVVGVESKKPGDLINSFNSRRLARQFATLLEVVDVPVLLKRGVWPEEVMTMAYGGVGAKRRPIWWHHDGPPFFTHRNRRSLEGLWVELARWQMLGGIVLEGPGPDHLVPAFLKIVGPTLAGNELARALAGSDYRKGPATKDNWAMLRAVPGIGEETVKKLKKIFSSPWEAIRGFMKDEWSGVKVSSRVKNNMQHTLGVSKSYTGTGTVVGVYERPPLVIDDPVVVVCNCGHDPALGKPNGACYAGCHTSVPELPGACDCKEVIENEETY